MFFFHNKDPQIRSLCLFFKVFLSFDVHKERGGFLLRKAIFSLFFQVKVTTKFTV